MDKLLVSFSGKHASKFGPGALFRIIATRAGLYEVELLKVHSAHPLYQTPIKSWVAGLSGSPDRLFLKQSMVYAHVDAEEEYDQLIIGAARRDTDKERIGRLIRLLATKFDYKWKETSRAIDLLISEKAFIYSSSGKPKIQEKQGAMCRLVVDWDWWQDMPDLPKDWNLDSRLEEALGKLQAFSKGIDVTIKDPSTAEVQPLTEPSETEIRSFFYVKEASEGRYIVKRSAYALAIPMKKIGKAKVNLSYDEALNCITHHLIFLREAKALLNELEQTPRNVVNLRAILSGLRIRDS